MSDTVRGRVVSTIRISVGRRCCKFPDARGMRDDHLPYELLAVPFDGEEEALSPMGRYRTYDEALQAATTP